MGGFYSAIPAIIVATAAGHAARRFRSSDNKSDERGKILLLEGGMDSMKISENETILIGEIEYKEDRSEGKYKDYWDFRLNHVKFTNDSLTALLQEVISFYGVKEFQLIPYAVCDGFTTKVCKYQLLLKVNAQKELKE